VAAVSSAALASTALAHGAPSSAQVQARQLGSGCEPNGLPSSLAVCEGTGRLNVRLKGTAVLSVQGGRVTLKGKAERVCRMKRVKRKDGRIVTRRVCSKRAKPILPRGVTTRKARGYTIFIGERLYFYLPAGNWRVSAEGSGLSLSAVGEGLAGVKAQRPPDDTVAQPGLISVGGELYNNWPRRWTRYDFGPDVAVDEPDDDQQSVPTSGSRAESAAGGVVSVLGGPGAGDSVGSSGSGLYTAKRPPEDDAGDADSVYSSGAQLPTDSG